MYTLLPGLGGRLGSCHWFSWESEQLKKSQRLGNLVSSKGSCLQVGTGSSGCTLIGGVELPGSGLVPSCWRKGETGLFFYRLISPLFAHFPWLEVLGSLFQEEEEQRTRSLISAGSPLKCFYLHRDMQEAVRNKSPGGTMAKKYGHKPSPVNICHSRFLLVLQAQSYSRDRQMSCP